MTPTLLLLNIISGVALLLFGLQLIRSGVTRAFGNDLRRLIALAAANRFSAFLTGILVTAVLQSSMATTLLVTSFAQKALVSAPLALAIILGADVGTTLVAQVLTFNLSWLAPLILVVGYGFYSSGANTSRMRQAGRIFIGLALMLMALSVIREAADPLRESETLPLLLAPLHQDPIMAVLFAAVFTWLCHSSLASILFFSTLVSAGLLPVSLGLEFVLGVNLGGVLPPLLATMRDGPAAARLPAANLLIRFVGVATLLPFTGLFLGTLQELAGDDARAIIHAHTGFNVLVALVALPFVDVISKIMTRIIPDKQDSRGEDGRLHYLDERALETPVVALTYASREALRIADLTETMLRDALNAFESNDGRRLEAIRETDTLIDTLYKHLKLYMARLGREALTEEEQQRQFQILMFATNLEHIGDIVDHNLRPMAKRLSEERITFSSEGFSEIRELFVKVIDSVRLAQTVFLTADPKLAQQLVDDKQLVKHAEIQTSLNHLARLQKGVPETLATTNVHMDVIRDLRRINSLIVSIAYPIIERNRINEPSKEPNFQKVDLNIPDQPVEKHTEKKDGNKG